MSFEEFDNMTYIQSELMKELGKGISLSRDDLVENLCRARTTIYDNLEILEKRKLVKRYRKQNGLRGRPLTLWFIPRNLLHELFKNIGSIDKKT